MRKYNKLIALLLAVVMAAVLIGCGGGSGGNEPTTQATPGPADNTGNQVDTPPEIVDAAPLDFGGRNFKLGNWWEDNDAEEGPPANLREEEFREYRDYIFDKHNFTWRTFNIGGWGDAYMEMFVTATMSGDHPCDLYIMAANWAFTLMNQGLLFDFNTLDNFDINDPLWNTSTMRLFTRDDGSVYAIA